MAERIDELRMTVAEFLDWDDGTDTRYELIDGRPVAIAPVGASHSRLFARLCVELERRLPRGCGVYGEAGVRLPWSSRRLYEADVTVACGGAPGDRLPPSPLLVVEIPSPATRRIDKGVKLDDYRRLPSVMQILLVDSTRRRVQSYRRGDADTWLVQDFVGSAVVPTCLGDAPIPLDELYAGVDLPPETDEDGQDQPTQ